MSDVKKDEQATQKIAFNLLKKYIGDRLDYDAIHEELKGRYDLGMSKYGQPLMTNDGHDKRDAREELLDCIMYQICAIENKVDLSDLQPLVDVISSLIKKSSIAAAAATTPDG